MQVYAKKWPMQVNEKGVYAGLCDFGFYCKLKLKKSGLCSLCKSGLCRVMQFWFYCKLKLKKVVYAGLCNFGFYCKLKQKKFGLCKRRLCRFMRF